MTRKEQREASRKARDYNVAHGAYQRRWARTRQGACMQIVCACFVLILLLGCVYGVALLGYTSGATHLPCTTQRVLTFRCPSP
jgi:EamA domain-containing membrane protein RarD